MIIKRKLYSESDRKTGKGELGTYLITSGGSTLGFLGGLKAADLKNKLDEKKIRKSAIDQYKKEVKKSAKNLDKGYKKLEELAGKNINSKDADEIKDIFKKMRKSELAGIKSKVKSDREAKLLALNKKGMKRYLKYPVVGVLAGGALSAPAAYKYYKKKNPDYNISDDVFEKTYKPVALGALLGHSTGMAKEMLSNKPMKDRNLLISAAIGAGVGYGAKKVYDKLNRKKEKEDDN